MPRGSKPRSNQPSREWLEQKYVVEGLTNRQIADLTGYSLGGISNLIWKLGLRVGGSGSRQRLDIDRDALYRMHVVEGLTAVRIAAVLGVNNGTISRYIKRWGLDPGRPLVNVPMIPPINRDELWKLYWVGMLSLPTIGAARGVSGGTVGRWMRWHGIPARKWNGNDDFTRTYVRGEGAKRGGANFVASQREAIFRRDGYRCQMPGCGSAERLEANHILPVEYGGGCDRLNGITLCHTCHASIRKREMGFKVLFDGIVKANTDRPTKGAVSVKARRRVTPREPAGNSGTP